MNKPIITIAIADDHPLIRQGMISLLHANVNFKVVAEGCNGIDLLARLAQLEQIPDIAILDIDMPEMDGYTTARELKKEYPSIKIISLSFHENEFNIIKMINSGAVGYLVKGNTTFESTITAIEHVYDKGYYYSDAITSDLFDKAKNTQMQEFTEHEMHFLRLCCDGLSDKEIADKMFVTISTVDYYYKCLSKKLSINKRIGLVAFALRTGIIPLQ